MEPRIRIDVRLARDGQTVARRTVEDAKEAAALEWNELAGHDNTGADLPDNPDEVLHEYRAEATCHVMYAEHFVDVNGNKWALVGKAVVPGRVRLETR